MRATIPLPKWCCQTRFTMTRAVNGWAGAVNQRATGQHQQCSRQALHSKDKPGHESTAGHLQYQPRKSDQADMVTDHRDEVTNPEDEKVPIFKQLKHAIFVAWRMLTVTLSFTHAVPLGFSHFIWV